MYSVAIPTKLVGQEFKTEMPKYQIRVIEENENDKISNDTFWKSNQYEGEDAIGQRLDLTSLLDKPAGYLQGKLSGTGDVDYYKFNMWQYRGLNMVDKYNRDVTVTLDHVPAGCEYELFLYDENGNQVGIGKDNGNGGVSVTVPNWSVGNRCYTVKVQAKDGSPVSEEYYHLSFQTKEAAKNQGAYQQRQEMSSYYRDFRQKLYEGGDATQEKEALQAIREKYDSYYAEQLEKLHKEQAEELELASTKSVAEVNTKQNEAEKLEAFKKEIWNEIDRMPRCSSINFSIQITDGAFKRMMEEPEFREKVMSVLAEEAAVARLPVTSSMSRVDENGHTGYSYNFGYGEEVFEAHSNDKDSFYKKTSESKKDKQKEMLEDYLEKRRQEQEFLQEMRTKEYFEHKEQQEYWNKRKSAAASYEANIMTAEP